MLDPTPGPRLRGVGEIALTLKLQDVAVSALDCPLHMVIMSGSRPSSFAKSLFAKRAAGYRRAPALTGKPDQEVSRYLVVVECPAKAATCRIVLPRQSSAVRRLPAARQQLVS